MTDTIVNLPFPGFYESMYSQEIDHAEEQESEWHAEREASERYYPETYQPEYLRISQSEYCELFMTCASYSTAYHRVAQWYIEAFDSWMAENLGTPAGAFRFESMDSPREYNFATDRLYAHVPLDVMESLFARSAAGGHELLAACIAERFTSYDGFISWYSNDVSTWLAKPLAHWDHNELGTLLRAMIPAGTDYESADEWRFEIWERTFGDEGGYTAFSDCVDWPKFEAAVTELRADKMDSAIESGLIETPADIPYRCPLTLELPLADYMLQPGGFS